MLHNIENYMTLSFIILCDTYEECLKLEKMLFCVMRIGRQILSSSSVDI